MDFLDFLEKAKKATYANENAKETRLEDGAKKLEYEEGVWRYVDEYKGSNPFYGTERVLNNENEVFVTNYFGKVVLHNDVGDVYAFLRQALRQGSTLLPLRGPERFEGSGCGGIKMTYVNSLKGSLDHFRGHEQILESDDVVYECDYHGGWL